MATGEWEKIDWQQEEMSEGEKMVGGRLGRGASRKECVRRRRGEREGREKWGGEG